MSDEPVVTPLCPLCGCLPVMVLGDYTQAFCGTQSCSTLTWNPRKGPDQIARATFVDLPDTFG